MSEFENWLDRLGLWAILDHLKYQKPQLYDDIMFEMKEVWLDEM